MFNSASSKNKAEATVNKLLGDLLPNVTGQEKHINKNNNNNTNNTNNTNSTKKKSKSNSSTPQSNTQILSNQFDLTIQPINTRKFKTQRNAKIKKFNQTNKKFDKLTKYTIIKQSNDKSINHEKYLQKLINRNINSITKYDIDNEDTQDQIQTLKSTILPSITTSKSRLRKKILYTSSNNNQIEFDEKVKKGWISMPGLTPGLAPVDYNEESD